MSSPPEAAEARPTVMIGDSSLLFAEALGGALARRGVVEVLEPHPQSGEEVARAAVIMRPDVAVLDLWLQGISGTAATRSIVAKTPDTRVVVLGWLHTADDVSHAFDAGASGFVSKAMDVDAVADAVAYVADGKSVAIDPSYRVNGTSSGGTAAAAEDAEPVDEPFTVRELEVLRLLGAGLPVEEVASRLDITRKTAQTHITRVLVKTGAHSQLQALAAARQRGYIV